MKKSSKIILIVVIVILLLVIGVGGYLLISKMNEANNKINELENKISVAEENEVNNEANENELNSNEIDNNNVFSAKKNESSNNNSENVTQKGNNNSQNASTINASEIKNKLNEILNQYSGWENTIIKISDINNASSYIINSKNATTNQNKVILVMDSNGVIATKEKNVESKNIDVYVDKENNILILGNLEEVRNGEGEYDQIELDEISADGFKKYAYSQLNENDGSTYLYINDEYVSFGDFIRKTEYVEPTKITTVLDDNAIESITK